MTGVSHPHYIVDASIAVKWFVPVENDADLAEALLKQFISRKVFLIVPAALFFIEVASALRGGRAGEAAVARSLKNLWSYGFEVQSVDEMLLGKANAISHAYRTSIYDAVYVALAESQGCPLITADEELVKRYKGHSTLLSLANLGLE